MILCWFAYTGPTSIMHTTHAYTTNIQHYGVCIDLDACRRPITITEEAILYILLFKIWQAFERIDSRFLIKYTYLT